MEKRGKEAESGRNKLPWKKNLISKTEKTKKFIKIAAKMDTEPGKVTALLCKGLRIQ